MKFALRGDDALTDSSGLFALVRLPLSWGESGHPQFLVILPDLRCLCLFLGNVK